MQVSRNAYGASRPMPDVSARRDGAVGPGRVPKPLRVLAGFIEDLAILGCFAFGREYGLDGAAKL